MSRRLSAKALFEQLMARMEPRIARAFRQAINGIRGRVNYSELVRLISIADIEGAVASLPLEPAAYDQLADVIRDEYVNAGNAHTANLPGELSQSLFSGRNPRAEAFLRDHSGELITDIVESQRTAVRETLVRGISAGRAPRDLASEIVGPFNRENNTRSGGILGLSRDQAEWAASARRELTEGPIGNYFQRERRNRNFDGRIRRALDAGTPIPKDVAEGAIRAYESRLLALRGEMIGRTEAMTGLHAAQWESLKQLVESGKLVAEQIRRIWRDSRDLRVRHTHASLNGQEVGLDEKFTSVSGAQLQYPGDPKAPGKERINCRCWAETVIDFFFGLQ